MRKAQGADRKRMDDAGVASLHISHLIQYIPSFLSGGGGSVRQSTAVLLGRCPQGDGEPGHVEDDAGAAGADARGAAKVHSAELGRAGGFKPGRQRPPMLNELCTRRQS